MKNFINYLKFQVWKIKSSRQIRIAMKRYNNGE